MKKNQTETQSLCRWKRGHGLSWRKLAQVRDLNQKLMCLIPQAITSSTVRNSLPEYHKFWAKTCSDSTEQKERWKSSISFMNTHCCSRWYGYVAAWDELQQWNRIGNRSEHCAIMAIFSTSTCTRGSKIICHNPPPLAAQSTFIAEFPLIYVTEGRENFCKRFFIYFRLKLLNERICRKRYLVQNSNWI